MLLGQILIISVLSLVGLLVATKLWADRSQSRTQLEKHFTSCREHFANLTADREKGRITAPNTDEYLGLIESDLLEVQSLIEPGHEQYWQFVVYSNALAEERN